MVLYVFRNFHRCKDVRIIAHIMQLLQRKFSSFALKPGLRRSAFQEFLDVVRKREGAPRSAFWVRGAECLVLGASPRSVRRRPPQPCAPAEGGVSHRRRPAPQSKDCVRGRRLRAPPSSGEVRSASGAVSAAGGTARLSAWRAGTAVAPRPVRLGRGVHPRWRAREIGRAHV